MTKRGSTRAVWTALSAAAAAAGVFFAGMYAARAIPGGETRRALSFSGTLTGRTGPQMLTFTFRKGATAVCAPTVTTTPDPATGAVHLEIPLDACPTTLFDGADVVYEVSVGGTVLSPAQAINPVPYAAYADRVGTPDCPTGYERFTEPAMPATAIYCRKGNDEVVRVGSGAGAYWMDRYLNSIWSNPDGTGTQYQGNNSPIAENGAWTTPAYAASRSGVSSAGFVNWFRANALCRISGKVLPSAEEFLTAAVGSPCYGRIGTAPRPDECPGARGYDYNAGSTPQCISRWGVEQICSYRYQWSRSLGYTDGSGGPEYGAYSLAFGILMRDPFLAVINTRSRYGEGGFTTPSEVHGFRCMIPR